MLLSDKKILQELKTGRIQIQDFDQRQLSTNSYDVRLDNVFFMQKPVSVIVGTTQSGVEEMWGKPQTSGRYIQFPAGEMVLCRTREIIGARDGITTKMQGRSSIARLGLSVEQAGLGDSGYIAQWTCEICNHTKTDILLPVGIRVAQIMFFKIGKTLKEYDGKYGFGEHLSPNMLSRLYDDYDLEDVLAGKYIG